MALPNPSHPAAGGLSLLAVASNNFVDYVAESTPTLVGSAFSTLSTAFGVAWEGNGSSYLNFGARTEIAPTGGSAGSMLTVFRLSDSAGGGGYLGGKIGSFNSIDQYVLGQQFVGGFVTSAANTPYPSTNVVDGILGFDDDVVAFLITWDGTNAVAAVRNLTDNGPVLRATYSLTGTYSNNSTALYNIFAGGNGSIPLNNASAIIAQGVWGNTALSESQADGLLADPVALWAAADTTAPTLTGATGTATGSTTATGSVTTDEANGTLYRLASTNATETAATVVAAALSQTVTATGSQAVSFTGLTASTTYYAHYVHDDAASNRSARVSSSSFTTSTPDTTAPTLSSGVGTVKSNALIVVGATTNEANGTMYVVATTSATAPSAAQVKAGQNNGGTAAVFAANQSISSTGAKTFNATGFTQLTGYYPYIVHTDAAGNDSAVLSVGLRTTFRNGATAQYVIDNTAAVGGNPAGALYALALTKSADDWMAYRTISGPTPGTGTLTENADGSFTFVGPDAAIWVIQPEVNGVDDAGGQITIELYDQASDVTPPTLTTATGTKTGATTATGTVTTSEGLGTLYYLTNTSATALSAAVLAGSTQTVTASGVQNISRTGLTASTTYYHHFLHKDPAGNESAVLSSNSFTTDAVADVTPPTLTSPTGATLGPTGAVGSVSTNEANGTLYWLTNTSATATDAAIKAANSQAVTATGVQNVTSSGLTASTVYYNHFLHRDAAGNDSTRSTSASFTTAAPGGPVTGNDHGGVAMRSCMRPAMYPAMNEG